MSAALVSLERVSTHPGVSVVMPIRNEERHLAAAVQRVVDQDYPGDLEIVLSIGPSHDETHAVADRLAVADSRIRVVDNPSGRTPAALNIAVREASHDIIVRVDGHGELCDGYLESAVRTLEETGAANVGGLMDAQGTTPFEQAVAAAYNSRWGLGGGGFPLADPPEGPATTVFLGAFRRVQEDQLHIGIGELADDVTGILHRLAPRLGRAGPRLNDHHLLAHLLPRQAAFDVAGLRKRARRPRIRHPYGSDPHVAGGHVSPSPDDTSARRRVSARSGRASAACPIAAGSRHLAGFPLP